MEPQRRQLNRIIGFIERLKTRCYPNAESYAAELHDGPLAASVRTIKRDIAYLRDVLDCPLEYDPEEHGYALVDEHWAFPIAPLCGAEVLPNVGVGGGIELALSPVLREAMYAPVSLVRPEAAEVQALLPLILATNGIADLQADTIEDILYAWKQRHVLRVDYTSPRRSAARRDIEIHALFAQEGIWYARVWCRLRNAARTLALHRVADAHRTQEAFLPREGLLTHLRTGNVLGLETVENVKVRCAADCAGFYAEREWFAGQYDRRLPDGGLEMLFPRVPRPVVVSWILYNAPELQVVEPEELRAEIMTKARAVANAHHAPQSTGRLARYPEHDTKSSP